MSVVCTSLLCCRCGSVFCPFWFWTSLFVLVLTLVLSLWRVSSKVSRVH